MPIIISVEGNIGSGKSTLVHELTNNAKLNNEFNICFLQEPIDIWNTVKDKNNETILEKFYKDQSKYAFQFQMMAYITRINQMKNAINENYDIIITERCYLTDRNVFAKMLYDNDKIEEIEYIIYNKWFEEFIKDIPQIFIVYLKTSPNVAFQRMLERSRIGENIEFDYINSCHNYHEMWIENEKKIDILKNKLEVSSNNSKKILEINGDKNFRKNYSIMENWIDQIINFIGICK